MDLEHFATTAMPLTGMRRPLSSRFAPAGWLRGSRIGVFFFAPHVMYPAPPGPEWVWCPRAPWDSSLAFLGHDPSSIVVCPPGPQPAVATDSMPLDGSSRRPLRRRQRRRRAVRLEPPGIAADAAPSDVSGIRPEADPNGPGDGSSAPESPPSLEVPSWSVSSRAMFDLRNSNSFAGSPRRPTIDSDVLNNVLQDLLDRNILERARPTIGSGSPSIDGTVERQQLGAELADAVRPAPERREALRPEIEPRGVVQARIMSRQLRAPSRDMQAGPSRRRPHTGAHLVIPTHEVPPPSRPGRGYPAATRAQQQVRPGSIVVYNSNRRRYQPETMPRVLQADPSQGRSPSSRQRSRRARRVYAGAFPWYDPLFSSHAQLAECPPFQEPSSRSERDMRRTIVSLTDLHRLRDILVTIMQLRVTDVTATFELEHHRTHSDHAPRQSPGRLICPALSGLDLFVAVIDSLWLAEETAVDSALDWMEGELPGLRDRQRNFSQQFHADRQFLRRRAERADANLRNMASGSQPRRLLSSVRRSIRALFGEDSSSISSDDSNAEPPAEEHTRTNTASRNADELASQERHGLLPAVRRLDSHRDDAFTRGVIRDREMTARDGINEIFTCPMCRDPILPLYTQCPRGHAVCDRCRRSYTDRRCLVCRIDHIPQINSVLSSLSDKLSFPCRYNYLGCPWNPLGTEWREHVQGCAYCPGLSDRTREQISALIARPSRSSAE
ncbi:hypothetical protein QAD02_022065 [Eretmocerus hayati]|uniref:Uncharacterized protein n=3 Tax=Eretmocerus hayati TaxID=131215 RepID=A0ACC2PRX1_9HYME|nr:hypothetical protein QAD02_010300 [Eretmocerus hayati]KAJ8672753.1 hypothetical protein QAD02_004013 [Eretmocerus hayati]KAJ8686271.1 hypothetical protein QAD02_022065 [Eretmocerus hayati]